MRIASLRKIRNHRVFKNFTWPNGLPKFAQFNVIYGWNGSGKTALSVLFMHLQHRNAISESDVEFELDDGKKIIGSDIPTANIPSVRVFNRDFVATTIEAIDEDNVAPIYFLGKESIEKQKNIEALKKELVESRKDLFNAKVDKLKKEKDFSTFCTDTGTFIREALLGSPDYKNYDKRKFKDTAEILKNEPTQQKVLSEQEKENLRNKKEQQPKQSISKISILIPDLGQMRSQTSELLKRSVISKAIDELVRNPDVGFWVQQGLALHTGERKTDTCRFCGNELSEQRQAELEAHFNDAFSSFQTEINQTIEDIKNKKKGLESIQLPNKAEFYDDLINEFEYAERNVKQFIELIKQTFGRLKERLEIKKTRLFEPLTLEVPTSFIDSVADSLSSGINEVNTIINRHNTRTENLDDEIREACKVLEQSYVLDKLPEYNNLKDAMMRAKAILDIAKQKPTELEEKIRTRELEIIEHLRPAEEINHDLQAYLGHNELRLKVRNAGYEFIRGQSGEAATNLSEGERTAIAFLYFLKSLEDKDFNLKKSIVVIDDPVSSLDSNALFSAFGYMKERTKESYQLFILTHNFAFFRQVKRWFHHLQGQRKRDITKRPGRFYMLFATVKDGERSAIFSLIDPLLEQFESEYHFLFKKVYEIAKSTETNDGLEQFYGMPNIARRMLETFLSYRFPDCSGDLEKQLERVSFDSSKKTSILRFLHTYSHLDRISEPEHDLSMLGKTKEVMNDILKLIETADKEHYQGMMRLMQPVAEE